MTLPERIDGHLVKKAISNYLVEFNLIILTRFLKEYSHCFLLKFNENNYQISTSEIE